MGDFGAGDGQRGGESGRTGGGTGRQDAGKRTTHSNHDLLSHTPANIDAHACARTRNETERHAAFTYTLTNTQPPCLPTPVHTCSCPPAPSRPPARTGAGSASGAHLRAQTRCAGYTGRVCLVQAKAPTTAADWAHAYAELAKEKHAQLSVLTKKNRILTKENAVLAKEKDALANELAAAISQCTARGCSTGLLGAPMSPSFASPSLVSRHSFSALTVARAMCAAAAAVDVAAAMPPRQAVAAGAEPGAEARSAFELDQSLQARLPRFESQPCNL
jgi:hypothetical protein